jgi:hypothetical protein
VSFDEGSFPFAEPSRSRREADFEFLDDITTNVPAPLDRHLLFPLQDLSPAPPRCHTRLPESPRCHTRPPALRRCH